ncbi:MAG: hypothetical protein E7604_06060 [Ruminococcaceae bacterium]|nr:hypothetical protein [Oscillospiraceae bacterium]
MKIVRFLILTAALLSVMLLPAAAWEQCPIHAFDYHSFPDTLIKYVGEDAFAAWYGPYQTPDENRCYEKNIYNFIHDFDIPYEVFADWYYGFSYYDTDHAPALLYSDDITAVEQYYSSPSEREREQENDLFSVFGRFKWRLEENARAADDAASRAFVDAFCEDGRVSIANWSIADYIRITGITQDDLTARLHWCLMQYDVIKKEPGYDAAYLIDFTPLYETDMTGDAYEAIPEFLRVHTEDALVCSRGYENLKLPENYFAPPTSDSGLLPSLVIFAMSSAAILLYRKKKDKKS